MIDIHITPVQDSQSMWLRQPDRFASALLKPIGRYLFFILSSLFMISCTGSLYKVKPPSALAAMPASAARVDLNSLSIRAAPLLTDEETQELFESNLQLAGLLPVRIDLIQKAAEPTDLRKVRLHLRDASGAEMKFVSMKQAVKRILKANEVFFYNPDSRKKFESEMSAHGLDLHSPLTLQEKERHGLVIFQTQGKQPVASPHGLLLTIDGLPEPATLKLN